ncbi:putative membrane protein DUF2177 [Natrinema hispanicum]|uniref:Putative membrane protein DUF2177 n=1 Tax=Natrinema hispanicum TaxID=392421 RepID=A0A482Y4S1_9EURY|nr:DUF2177 family protein [Natrinema hispanicum]RZV06573.1 putative membrane protein DUF2177 [Natrinema hispanicum]
MSRRHYRSRLLTWVLNSGPDDPVYNLYLMLGPLLILFVVLVGRNSMTTVLVAGYIVGFVVYTIYNVSTTLEHPDWVQHP